MRRTEFANAHQHFVAANIQTVHGCSSFAARILSPAAAEAKEGLHRHLRSRLGARAVRVQEARVPYDCCGWRRSEARCDAAEGAKWFLMSLQQRTRDSCAHDAVRTMFASTEA